MDMVRGILVTALIWRGAGAGVGDGVVVTGPCDGLGGVPLMTSAPNVEAALDASSRRALPALRNCMTFFPFSRHGPAVEILMPDADPVMVQRRDDPPGLFLMTAVQSPLGLRLPAAR